MPRQLLANSAAVAAHHPHGARAGIEMIESGGNAVDAAVAAMLALCVVVPGSVGLGGYGGSAVVYSGGSSEDSASRGAVSRKPAAESRQPRIFAIDFDSRAPLAFRDGLVTADRQSSHYGPRSVTVPAVVAGLDLTLREFGTRSWRDVSQPAIRLAEEGFDVDSEHRRSLDRCAPHFDGQSLTNLFPAGAVPDIGKRWRQPALARLLRRLADEGPAAFYEGDIAQTIVGYLADRGGILTADDFRTYRPRIVEPLHARCREFDLYTPPPPSGGITSLAIVQTMDQLLRADSIQPWGGRYFHLLAEAAKRCWQERHRYVGDPDFAGIPADELLSERSAAARSEQIKRCGANLPNPSYPRLGSRFGSPHTANVIAIDDERSVVSITATQGSMYGSHLVDEKLGLVLNHGMSRFDYSPGHPNAPGPGKRMQHNMSPLIAFREGKAVFALGMPGGPKIVSVTAQLALSLIAFRAAPAAAIAAPRLHTEGDEPLLVSQHMPEDAVAELAKLGHAVCREEDMGGPVNVLAVDAKTGRINVASGDLTGDVAGL